MRRTLRCFLLGSLLSMSGSLAEDSAPVLLRSDLLLTPIETAGTELAPEVQVRAKIDERGRVIDVEVLSITPSSEFDELFSATTREAVASWRYAPAVVNGKNEGRELDFSVQFKAQTESVTGSGKAMAPLRDPEELRSRYLALAPEQRIALLQELSRKAEKQLSNSQRKRFDTPHFVVISDSSEPGTAEAVGNNLEAIYHILDRLNEPPIPIHPEAYKVVVYVFQSRASYLALLRETQSFEWSSGFYSPTGLIALHLEMLSSEWFVGALLHETTHAWVDRHLVRQGRWLPRWLGEGLAEYVGHSRIKKGQLIPGKILRGRYVFHPSGSGAVRGQTRTGLSLDDVRGAIRKGEGITLKEVFDAKHVGFYGERRDQFYPTAWLLVHYLRHGEAEWERRHFPTLLLYLAEGYPARQAFEAIYGAPPEAFEERFRTYVRKL